MNKAASGAPAMPGLQLPPIQPEAQEYWDAAANGVLLAKTCGSCSKVHFYPRSLCPFCASADTRWTECSGAGEIYSFTIIRRGLPQPQVVAYVTLDEGPTVLTAIGVDDLDAVAIGQKVSAYFADVGFGRPLLMFQPVQ